MIWRSESEALFHRPFERPTTATPAAGSCGLRPTRSAVLRRFGLATYHAAHWMPGLEAVFSCCRPDLFSPGIWHPPAFVARIFPAATSATENSVWIRANPAFVRTSSFSLRPFWDHLWTDSAVGLFSVPVFLVGIDPGRIAVVAF